MRNHCSLWISTRFVRLCFSLLHRIRCSWFFSFVFVDCSSSWCSSSAGCCSRRPLTLFLSHCCLLQAVERLLVALSNVNAEQRHILGSGHEDVGAFKGVCTPVPFTHTHTPSLSVPLSVAHLLKIGGCVCAHVVPLPWIDGQVDPITDAMNLGDFPYVLMSNHEPQGTGTVASLAVDLHRKEHRGEDNDVFFILCKIPEGGAGIKTLSKLKNDGHQEKGR